MARTLLRDKVRMLRSRGASLNELASRLNVPKSTIRYWCRDIALSDVHQKRLFRRQKLGGIRAAEKIRALRMQREKILCAEGCAEIGEVSKRELLLIGAALYWAEGYRKGSGEFGFTNSDPHMIQFILRWLNEACSIPRDRIYLRVCVNASHKKRLSAIHQFWSQTTGMPLSQFSNPTLIHVSSKKKYLNSAEYFGTLRIKVRRSTDLRRKIIGWIEGLAKNH